MKKLLYTLFVLIALSDSALAADRVMREYGAATTVNFDLWETDGTDLKTDAVDGGTDCNIVKDEGASATCANDFVDEGNNYSIALSASEMQAARISVCFLDSATKAYLDKCIYIDTYGNASSQFPDAKVTVEAMDDGIINPDTFTAGAIDDNAFDASVSCSFGARVD